MILMTPSFSKSFIFKMFFNFRPHENKKPAFSNSSGLKSVFATGRPNSTNKISPA